MTTAAQTIFIEDMAEGQTATYTRIVDEQTIVAFAQASGDTNPVHLDQEFASATMFKGRIAHGVLSTSFVSTVLGTQLPGQGTILLKIDNVFRAPVHIDDELTPEVVVSAIDRKKNRVTFTCRCRVGDKVVTEGSALVIAPSRSST